MEKVIGRGMLNILIFILYHERLAIMEAEEILVLPELSLTSFSWVGRFQHDIIIAVL